MATHELDEDDVHGLTPVLAQLVAMRRLITTTELANMLTVSRRTIEAWIYTREIEVVRISSRCVRHDPSVVARWLRARMRRAEG